MFSMNKVLVADAVRVWYIIAKADVTPLHHAVNQQKFHFEYVSLHGDGVHRVKAERGFSLIGYTKMDLGIAKYHFEVGAGKENFEWV